MLVPALASAGHLLVVSRGASTPIAHEGALKIMETVRLPALSYSAADLEHGPIACVRDGTPVIVIDSAGPAAGSLSHVISRLVDLGAEVIPMQLMAHQLSTGIGNDPDQPPGLTKVTRTS